MDAAVRTPMSRDEFFAWAERQELRHEFDGVGPVAMTGGNVGHSRLIRNVNGLLQRLLDGTAWESLGPEAGVATVGNTVRYPDAVVTSTLMDNQARLVPDPVVVFEIVSPTSVRIDRIVKLREYAAVPTILCYVMVEAAFIGITVFARPVGQDAFEAESLPEDGAVTLPGIGLRLPVSAIYRGVFAPWPGGTAKT